jgi:hypothetical protein
MKSSSKRALDAAISGFSTIRLPSFIIGEVQYLIVDFVPVDGYGFTSRI